ncbi:MAG: carbohydrate binding domain-containing protein, partial [Lachnospiraceae bacterium]|nr:carbohydrate binding domain-containing protein [Lachnospiraceae bacterium]
GTLTDEELGFGTILETPFGIVLSCNTDNTIDVVWGQGDINNYNIYVDDILVKSNVPCGGYRLQNIPAGERKVSLTTTKDGKESPKLNGKVTVTGSSDIVITQVSTTERVSDTNNPTNNTTEKTSTYDQENGPIEVFGLDVSSKDNNRIRVVWGQSEATIALGQKYNIYLDGELVRGEVPCGEYVFTVSSGSHIVKVTSKVNGIESSGRTANIDVTGEVITTTNQSEFVEGRQLLNNTTFADAKEWNEYGATYTNNGDGSVSVTIPKKTSGDNWSTQLVDNGLVLSAGKYYKASVTINSNVARKFQLLIQSDGADGGNWSVINSDNKFAVEADKPYTFTTIFKAESVQNNYLYGIMMGYIDQESESANVTISNVSLKEFSSLEEAEKDNGSVVVENPTPVEISGFQISAVAGGVRTIYSVEPKINGKDVVERGLIYGRTEYVSDSEMIVGSNNKKVFSFAAVNGLLSGVNYSDSETSQSYVMTMTFGAETVKAFEAEYMVRAYAKLSDGTYVYSDTETYSPYSIAEYVYNNNLMPNVTFHNYLYNTILKKVNPSYKVVAFNGTYDVVKNK